jgi:Holliday junction resolvase RusA-like endonuclease
MITFFVPGRNVPQGSKKVWVDKAGNPRMRESAGQQHATRRHEVWMAALEAAREAGRWSEENRLTPDGGPLPFTGPVAVRLVFHRLRGTSHYGSGRNAQLLKPSAPDYPTTPPDVDKLVRLVLDSLTSVLFVDDAQVVDLGARKVWADRFHGTAGVEVYVKEIAL